MYIPYTHVNSTKNLHEKIQHIDWLRACQLIPNRVQKSEISADSWN